MQENPERSLGVVALNQAQRELIQDEIDRMVAHSPEAAAYREHWEETLEPFFVKNLENVQGDERDVIFISVTYGPSEPGAKVLQRFGPINSAIGHRRLNVLFTRAKECVILFSSMDAADVRVEPESRAGVKALNGYLAYAATGRLETGQETGREPDSDFERVVMSELRRRGYTVSPQVGVAGFFIDLGIRHAAWPHGYLLGIECDGATYHSAKSARDRDRLRQEVLERLGWTIYRIWSTDWFNDPTGETHRLVQRIENLASEAHAKSQSFSKPELFALQGGAAV